MGSASWTCVGSLGSGGMVGTCILGPPAVLATWPAQSCFLPRWAFWLLPLTRLFRQVLTISCHSVGLPSVRTPSPCLGNSSPEESYWKLLAQPAPVRGLALSLNREPHCRGARPQDGVCNRGSDQGQVAMWEGDIDFTDIKTVCIFLSMYFCMSSFKKLSL